MICLARPSMQAGICLKVVQIGALHSSSISWRLLRTKVLCLSSLLSRCWLQAHFFFSTHLGKQSVWLIFCQMGWSTKVAVDFVYFAQNPETFPFGCRKSVYRFLLLHLISARKMSFSEESRALREEASRATWRKDEGDTGECWFRFWWLTGIIVKCIYIYISVSNYCL